MAEPEGLTVRPLHKPAIAVIVIQPHDGFAAMTNRHERLNFVLALGNECAISYKTTKCCIDNQLDEAGYG